MSAGTQDGMGRYYLGPNAISNGQGHSWAAVRLDRCPLFDDSATPVAACAVYRPFHWISRPTTDHVPVGTSQPVTLALAYTRIIARYRPPEFISSSSPSASLHQIESTHPGK